ncbi:MAG: nucleotide sugar dehydrogenase [Candidatus Omnitrophica bacterium]|nr:nucleotide sugar dehydrogenase [Candidatus Omnitrophota bacterium]MDD5352185.1 nucleotide sugar dehydrogenase [Candidatus Omnitrophota bacterium]MDD5549783.1 nucleotide sugar dehydrogenase [Candidatus Omnitrophota bacterium]
MLSFRQILVKKINNKRAKVAVIGLGYVGLPLAVEFADKGSFVYGIDIDKKKIAMLKQGKSYIQDIPSATLKGVLKNKLFNPSSDYGNLTHADIIIISVPTPLTKTREPDISYVVNAAREIKDNIRRGQLIILESTTYPGTTEEVLLPLFSQRGLKVGVDFFLAFSPERIDPANKTFNTANITKIVGGITKDCAYLTRLIYSKIISKVVMVSDSKVAEMAKLLENTFRAVNIGLINEFALMCDKLKVNIWEVIEAAETKPFGFMPFYPGPGLGGHCLPIDPLYLSWKSRLHGFEPRLIELASQINSYMPTHVVNKTVELIDTRCKLPVSQAKILVAGVSYKKDVCDVRESPAIEIIRMFMEKQAKVSYYDPFVSQISLDDKTLHSIKFTKENIRGNDCVVIVTNHSKIDYNLILKNADLIFDTRNVYKNINNPKVIRL